MSSLSSQATQGISEHESLTYREPGGKDSGVMGTVPQETRQR